MDMLKIEVITCLVVTPLLTATPAVADAARPLCSPQDLRKLYEDR